MYCTWNRFQRKKVIQILKFCAVRANNEYIIGLMMTDLLKDDSLKLNNY